MKQIAAHDPSNIGHGVFVSDDEDDIPSAKKKSGKKATEEEEAPFFDPLIFGGVEEDDEEEDEDEGQHDGETSTRASSSTGLLLSDVVDGKSVSSKKASAVDNKSSSSKLKKKSKMSDNPLLGFDIEGSDASDEFENDSDDEDDFDSADEGSNAASDDENEGDFSKMLSQLNKFDAGEESDEEAEPALAGIGAETLAGLDLGLGEGISTEDLLGSIEDSTDMGALKSQLEGIRNEAPLKNAGDSVKQAREDRKVRYEETSKHESKWLPMIQQARKSEQVVLGENETRPKGQAALMTEISAENDFEKELAAAIEESGLSQSNIKESGGLPAQDHLAKEKERQQIAKLKSLMAREASRNKRLKKIKSKTYRRIKNKADKREQEKLMERLEVENPEMAAKLREDYEHKYAKHRLMRQQAARKKWSIAANRFGGKEMRGVISEQANRMKDEKKRLERLVKGQRGGGSDSENSSDADGSDIDVSDDETGTTVQKAKLATLRELQDATVDAEDESSLPKTGLFGLKFMREGLMKKREAAKEEAKNLLEEINKLESSGAGANQDLDSDQEQDNLTLKLIKEKRESEKAAAEAKLAKKKIGASKEALEAARASLARKLEEDGITLGDLAHDDDVVTTSAPLKIDKKKVVKAAAKLKTSDGEGSWGNLNEWESMAANATPPAPTLTPRSPPPPADTTPEKLPDPLAPPKTSVPTMKKSSLKSSLKSSTKTEVAAAANPWLDAGSKPDSSQKSAKKGVGFSNMPAEIKSIPSRDGDDFIDEGDELDVDSDDENIFAGVEKEATTQRELIQQTFMKKKADGDVEDSLQERDFLMEMEKDEDELKPKEKEELEGWGTGWVGADVKPKKRKVELMRDEGQEKIENKAPKKLIRVSHVLDTKAAKYHLAAAPQPFANAEQYEAQLKHPLGNDWNTSGAHTRMIKPKIVTRVGAVVAPLEYHKHLSSESKDSLIAAWTNKGKKRLKARM